MKISKRQIRASHRESAAYPDALVPVVIPPHLAAANPFQRNEKTTDVWLTPKPLVDALGRFDLDPCSPPPPVMPWRLADRCYTEEDDGLSQPWVGRVWMNPPYGSACKHWIERIANHGDGVALIFARTETTWFHKHVWRRAQGILFMRGRIKFCRIDGTSAINAPAPSVLIAYGDENLQALRGSGIDGHLVTLANQEAPPP